MLMPAALITLPLISLRDKASAALRPCSPSLQHTFLKPRKNCDNQYGLIATLSPAAASKSQKALHQIMHLFKFTKEEAVTHQLQGPDMQECTNNS